MAIKAREMGFKRLIVPEANVTEAAVVNKIDVFGVKNLAQVRGRACRQQNVFSLSRVPLPCSTAVRLMEGVLPSLTCQPSRGKRDGSCRCQ